MKNEILKKKNLEIIELVKKQFIKSKSVQPSIMLHAQNLETSEVGYILINIPDETLASNTLKDVFVDHLLVKIADQIKQQYNINALILSFEAWIRTSDKVSDLENYQDLPIKTETLFMSIESIDSPTEFFVYEILRMSVNAEGNMMDDFRLEEMLEFKEIAKNQSGRFCNLLPLFLNKKNNFHDK